MLSNPTDINLNPDTTNHMLNHSSKIIKLSAIYILVWKIEIITALASLNHAVADTDNKHNTC